MSYQSGAEMVKSESLANRMSYCVALEDTPYASEPGSWVYQHRYELCSAPGWADAWDSAVAGGEEDPGGRNDVITDAMILAQVQELL